MITTTERQFISRKILPVKKNLPIDSTNYVDLKNGFIAIIEAKQDGVLLTDYIKRHRASLEFKLAQSGGIVFSGFSVPAPIDFSNAVNAFGTKTLPYMERAAVRSEVLPGVFTSTEFSSNSWIDLHHEMSFSRKIPARIFFYANITAEEGGETPVADEVAVTAAVNPDVLKELKQRGLRYVRNYRNDIDMDWRASFQTHKRTDVEKYCLDNNIICEWLAEDHLRTAQPQSAFIHDPQTDQLLLCNHAHIFHQAAMEPLLRESLLDTYGEQGLPRNVFFGDGEKIPDEVILHLRESYKQAQRTFSWKKGDVMMLNNLRCLHGRAPFKGKRSTLVSMTGLLERDLLK
jgi:alpha-ketoglutarate-dependent taurine dioxygenase